MLVFDSTTQQELLKDVAVFLRQLATNHQTGMARTKTETALNTARANALIVAAMDLEAAHVASGEEQPKGNLCVSCFAPIAKGGRFCAPCDPRE